MQAELLWRVAESGVDKVQGLLRGCRSVEYSQLADGAVRTRLSNEAVTVFLRRMPFLSFGAWMILLSKSKPMTRAGLPSLFRNATASPVEDNSREERTHIGIVLMMAENDDGGE